LRIILIGYGELASSLLLGILTSGHKLVGILRWERIKHNNLFLTAKDIIYPDKLSVLMHSHNVHEIKAKSANSKEFWVQAMKLEPDIIIIGSWGEILKKKTIILPKIACINCHPSLLPKHRGPNPYASTIRHGEQKSGITFHLVDEGLDTGPILLQKELLISPDDTGGSLRNKCAFLAKQNIKQLLDNVEKGVISPVKQDEKNASYYPQIKENDALINWHNTAEYIHNQIRGLNPWLKCYTKHKGHFLTIEASELMHFENTFGQPGEIIAKTGNSLVVSTGSSGVAVAVKGVRVYEFAGSLWSSYYINNAVKIGDVLVNM
jgi:methionyl-tRNA formyltransferase